MADDLRLARHESLVFSSDALKITADPFERTLDYDLRVPLLVFRNDNQNGRYLGTVYVPKSLSGHRFTQNDVDLSRLLMRRPNYFEFLFLLDGEYEEKINDRLNLYTPGTCRIAYQNTRHLENFSKNYSAIYFCVSPRMVSEIRSAERLSSGDDVASQLNPTLSSFLGINTTLQTGIADYLLFQPKGQPKDLISQIRGIADEIKTVSDAPHYGSLLMINGLFGKLLSLLSDPSLYSINHVQLNTSPEAILFNQLSQLLCESKGLLSRAELEDRLNYSGSHISAVARKFSGMTLFDYSMTFCMEEAAMLLTQSGKSIAEIAGDLNFSNRTHFYKQFKKRFQVTPHEYRKIKAL